MLDSELMLTRRMPQRPKLDHPRDIIEIPAVDEPHLGISYNPPVDAHTELIIKAANVEQQLEKEAEALKRLKEKIHGALDSSEPSSSRRGEPLGMIVDDSIDDEKPDANTVVDQLSIAKKAPRRKTQQQKAKAARNKTEVNNCIFNQLATDLYFRGKIWQIRLRRSGC